MFVEQEMADVHISAGAFEAPTPMNDEDHVRWQASQSCELMKQLIVSTENKFNISHSRGSQRQRSFGQLLDSSTPTGTRVRESSPQSDSSGSFRFSRPLTRVRHAEINSHSRPDPSLSIPFFDKQNPAQFFAVLKGVSARVDENAGVRKESGSGDRAVKSKRKKRFSNAGDPLTKRARTDPRSVDIEERRTAHQVERANPKLERLQGHHSLPNVLLCPHATWESTDENGYSMGISDLPGGSAFPSLLQAEMPPPAPPTKHPGLTHVSITVHQDSDLKDKTSDAVPKMHPLLLEKPTPKPLVTSSTSVAGSQTRARSGPQSIMDPDKSGPSPFSLTPGITSKPSLPPALGMRRSHTFPAHSYGSGLRTGVGLPKKQRSFKPPLLPSQSQQSQTRLNKKSTLVASSKLSNSVLLSQVNESTSLSSMSSYEEESKTPLSASSIADSDSSYGEFSFDQDTLEEVMRLYD